MLYWLYDPDTPFRVLKYITFRAMMGASTAFLLTLVAGPWVIERLRRLKFGQNVRSDEVLKSHRKKAGTPTMGGLLIIGSVLISCLLWSKPGNFFVLITLGTMLWMGGIGFLDDWLKVVKKQSKGLRARQKVILQITWTVIAFLLLRWHPSSAPHVSKLMLPFLKSPVIEDMGMLLTMLFVFWVLVGSTNAVNLTDGLDGLAIGCVNASSMAYLLMTYVAGHSEFARYLQVPYVEHAGELAVLFGCLIGAGLGFLWYNCHPAKVFMGDTGSLALGGALAMGAICIKQEIALIIVGFVFVMESASVMIQVASFKLTGRRVFRCAPIHHHFEILARESAERNGRDPDRIETMVVTRMWILAIVFAILGMATLKLR